MSYPGGRQSIGAYFAACQLGRHDKELQESKMRAPGRAAVCEGAATGQRSKARASVAACGRSRPFERAMNLSTTSAGAV
jgi:hypothetical protein